MKKKTMSKWLALLLTGAMAVGAMGCGAQETENKENSQSSEVKESSTEVVSSASGAEDATEELEYVKLKVISVGDPGESCEVFVEEVNKLLMRDLNCEIEIEYLME